MTPPVRLVAGFVGGALLGALLGFVIGGGVVFGRSLLADLSRPDGGFSILLENGWRIAAVVLRLFALPAAIGGGVAGLVAFRPGRAGAWGRTPGAAGPALAGLVAAALAAPAGLALYVRSVLGPGQVASGTLSLGALVNAAVLAGVAGLLAGLVVGRAAGRRRSAVKLR